MTIIVFRDGVMAGDSLAAAGLERIGTARRVFRSPLGHVGAGCGRESRVQAFSRWIEAGLPGEMFNARCQDPSGFGGILAFPDGRVAIVSHDGYANSFAADWYVSGSDPAVSIARGAFERGATAEQAVQIAIAYDIDCGGPTQVERLWPVEGGAVVR